MKLCPELFLFLTVSLGSPTDSSAQARLLAPDTISTNDVFGFSVTPDEKHSFFVKAYGGRDTLIVLTSQKKAGRWQSPQVAPFSFADKRYRDIDPIVTPDGSMVVFNSNRPLPGETVVGDFNIWASRRTGERWGDAFVLSNVLNSDSSDIYASMSRNGNLYFASSRAGGQGGLDLYRSELKKGTYLTPENLGPVINDSGSQSNPYVAPDESYVIYFSRTPNRNPGENGFLISFRKGKQWLPPVSLGLPEDPVGGAFCPFLSADGKTFYFSRTRVENNRRIENIYSIPADRLNLSQLRTQAQAGK